MKVTSTQAELPSSAQVVTQREKSPADFQTSLAAAQQNLDTTTESTTATKSKTDNSAKKAPQTAQEELAEYLRKTPAQHMRDAILKELGLTEEELAALPPEQRAAIEETIADRIKEKLEASTPNAPNPSTLSLLSMLAFAQKDASATGKTEDVAPLS